MKQKREKSASLDGLEGMDCRPGPSEYPRASAEALTPTYIKGKTAEYKGRPSAQEADT